MHAAVIRNILIWDVRDIARFILCPFVLWETGQRPVFEQSNYRLNLAIASWLQPPLVATLVVGVVSLSGAVGCGGSIRSPHNTFHFFRFDGRFAKCTRSGSVAGTCLFTVSVTEITRFDLCWRTDTGITRAAQERTDNEQAYAYDLRTRFESVAGCLKFQCGHDR